MSTIAARRDRASRPAAVSSAVVLTVILIVLGPPLFLVLSRGDETSGSVIVISIVAGLFMLVGVWGYGVCVAGAQS